VKGTENLDIFNNWSQLPGAKKKQYQAIELGYREHFPDVLIHQEYSDHPIQA